MTQKHQIRLNPMPSLPHLMQKSRYGNDPFVSNTRKVLKSRNRWSWVPSCSKHSIHLLSPIILKSTSLALVLNLSATNSSHPQGILFFYTYIPNELPNNSNVFWSKSPISHSRKNVHIWITITWKSWRLKADIFIWYNWYTGIKHTSLIWYK